MKMFKKKVLMIIVMLSSLIVTANYVTAHSLWVNSFESFVHKPRHTTVSLGWGHSLPIDDTLNSSSGKVIVEEFSISYPSGKKINLAIPESKNVEPTQTGEDFDIFDAEIGLQKISFKEENIKGVYLIHAKSKPTFYTQYIDNKNRTRLKLTSKDKLKDIKEVLMSVKYQAFAKSYLTLGKWTEQKAIGDGLEIIPKTDLSNLKIGDLVEFEVLFYGKPLHAGAEGVEYITANSSSFGQGHHFSLFSKIKKGKAQFIVQSSGQWIVGCGHKEDVKKEGELKDLYGKTNTVAHAATLTFTVK